MSDEQQGACMCITAAAPRPLAQRRLRKTKLRSTRPPNTWRRLQDSISPRYPTRPRPREGAAIDEMVPTFHAIPVVDALTTSRISEDGEELSTYQLESGTNNTGTSPLWLSLAGQGAARFIDETSVDENSSRSNIELICEIYSEGGDDDD